MVVSAFNPPEAYYNAFGNLWLCAWNTFMTMSWCNNLWIYLWWKESGDEAIDGISSCFISFYVWYNWWDFELYYKWSCFSICSGQRHIGSICVCFDVCILEISYVWLILDGCIISMESLWKWLAHLICLWNITVHGSFGTSENWNSWNQCTHHEHKYRANLISLSNIIDYLINPAAAVI